MSDEFLEDVSSQIKDRINERMEPFLRRPCDATLLSEIASSVKGVFEEVSDQCGGVPTYALSELNIPYPEIFDLLGVVDSRFIKVSAKASPKDPTSVIFDIDVLEFS